MNEFNHPVEFKRQVHYSFKNSDLKRINYSRCLNFLGALNKRLTGN